MANLHHRKSFLRVFDGLVDLSSNSFFKYHVWLCALGLVIAALNPVGAFHSAPLGTIRVTVALNGGEANGSSDYHAITDDGRFVAFASYADNLVPEDKNVNCGDHPAFPPYNCPDVFLQDLVEGKTTLVSRSFDGTQAKGKSDRVAVSGDGRVVAFYSLASDLVPNDTNQISDVFVYDVFNDSISRISVSSEGAEQGSVAGSSCGASCGGVSISGDGRFVVFDSWSDNLVSGPVAAVPSGDLNRKPDVFLHDRYTGQTGRISVGYQGLEADDASWEPGQGAVSDDGRFVVFQSLASNLILNDTNRCGAPEPFPQGLSCLDVFLRDRVKKSTIRVSETASGGEGNGPSGLAYISGNGRFVAFSSGASNLVPGDTNGFEDVFVKNLGTGELERITVAAEGKQGNGDSWLPSISADGRYVAFSSRASNLVPGDKNKAIDVFVYDRTSKTLVLASVGSGGSGGNALSTTGLLSGDGKHLAFRSTANNLAGNDTNNKSDIFVSDVFWAGPITPNGEPTYGAGESNSKLPGWSAWAILIALAIGIWLPRVRRPSL